jgi:hypothetical protein
LGQSRQVAGGSEGPLRTLHSFLLGDLVLHREQAGGKEPAGAPVAAEGNRNDGGASGGHDLPAFDNLTTLKIWADEGPPKARSTTTRIPTTTGRASLDWVTSLPNEQTFVGLAGTPSVQIVLQSNRAVIDGHGRGSYRRMPCLKWGHKSK